MYREDLRYYLHQLVNNTVFQQLAPVFIFFLIPALILTARAHKSTLLHPFFMVLEALSLAFPWNWYNGHSPAGSSSDKRKPRKKLVRTRAGQLLNGDAASAGML
ncbi:hypothetical protein PHLCEN_2v8119 [Hermanssonia centrifuga]|uniref:Uncharacterized protein n=1 Tax=Hermanssonia centrifuga TaxID=98765 RepID=A0A2R6NUK8_9APHY|nr:hypothetical protein PHLCEN_2v8119 [Hermanssonia centrifuga]